MLLHNVFEEENKIKTKKNSSRRWSLVLHGHVNVSLRVRHLKQFNVFVRFDVARLLRGQKHVLAGELLFGRLQYEIHGKTAVNLVHKHVEFVQKQNGRLHYGPEREQKGHSTERPLSARQRLQISGLLVAVIARMRFVWLHDNVQGGLFVIKLEHTTVITTLHIVGEL